MKLRCLIIDDEPLARLGIRHLLKKHPQFDVVAEAGNGFKAIPLVQQHQPHIIFLDIQMPGLNGLELLKQLPYRPIVIMCSAYAEHAITAFELNVSDYLLKPLNPERFDQALLKASHAIIQQMSLEHRNYKANKTSYLDRITIREPGRLRIIDVDDISWVESAGNYVEIHVYSEAKSFLQRDTMASMEQKLDPAVFARIHRSSIIRKSDIVELRPGDKGDAEVILKCGTQLTLSRRNRQSLSDLLGGASNTSKHSPL